MNQRILATTSIVLGVLLIISIGLLILFGVKLSNASDIKTKEISTNLTAQEKKLKAEFQAEKEKTIATYTAPDVFGSISFNYPKVWSTYIHQDTSDKEQLTFLGNPDLIVFDKQSANGGPYTALRVQIFEEKYTDQLSDAESKFIRESKNPFKESNITISSIAGKKFQGQNEESGLNYTFVLLPLRDKTLYIGTDDSDKYTQNFETILNSFKISK